MHKALKILLWTIAVIGTLMVVLFFFGAGIYGWLLKPDHEFGSKPLPAAPDYTQRSNWSAWPDGDSPAERLPDGVTPTPMNERRASAFFVHPTTYGGRDHWVQPMDHEETRYGTDHGTTSRQASAFNDCCRVYAPRYRQSNIMGYQEQDVVEQIFEIGYQDVRSAFLQFLEEIGPDEPFILASHSQGTFNLVRLIAEEVDGTPLMDRFVAAYAIGHALPRALVDEGFDEIKLCESPTQTGCFITWDAHEGDKEPSAWSNEEEEVLWNGNDYTGFAPGPRICVNPITWRTDAAASDPQDHLGALEAWSGFSELDASLGELVAGTVSAWCGSNGERNWLFVNGDRDEKLRSQGVWSYFGRNLHGADFSLFWENIRNNATERVDAFLNGESGASSSQPNVVVIFGDDVGYCDTELYGCDAVPTPNIKQLADDGARFTAGYVTSPVCSPSRASLMTGRYQHRFGHEFLPQGDPSGNAGLPASEITVANAMRDAGYVTGMVGKWHLGAKDEHHPLNRGFDEFFGMVTWGADYADPTRDDVIVWTHPHATPRDPNEPWAGRGDNNVQRGTEPVAEDAYLTDAFTREAVAFINNHKDRPFFLYVPYTAIHGPLQVTRKYYNRFPDVDDEAKRVYAAMTSALDEGIGEILGALEANGLERNTLVLFMSDNGAGVAEYANNAPLRLGKHTLFEGGVRVPFAMKWPARITAGSVYDFPVSTLDVFPTVVSLAGGTVPADRALDGVNLMPYINGRVGDAPHSSLFWRQGPNWAVRQGDWKLIHAAERNWLYSLADDVGEKDNIADQHPDVVARLTEAFAAWNSNNVDPLWPPLGGKSLPSFSVDGVAINWVL